MVVFAIILAIIQYIDRVAISQAAPLISKDLGLDKAQMAWVFAAFTMAYAAFEIPTGYWGDKMGARRVLIRVVLWWSFFTAATGWVWSFWSLFVVRFLFGAGEAGCFPNIARAFNRWLPRDERVRAQGILWMSARWGGAVAPLLLVLVLQYVNWRRAFELFAVLGVDLVRVLVPLVPRQAGRPSQGQRRRARADADLRGQVRSPARAVVGHVLVAARCGCSGSSTSRSATRGTSSSPGSRPT